MVKIYQRFNADTPTNNVNSASIPRQPTVRINTPRQHSANPQAKSSHLNRNQQPQSNHQHSHRQTRRIRRANNHSRDNDKAFGGLDKLIARFLPSSIYNCETKKLFGFLATEDLLLVALIFLFLDSEEEDSNLIALALLFVLVSDYIDPGWV